MIFKSKTNFTIKERVLLDLKKATEMTAGNFVKVKVPSKLRTLTHYVFFLLMFTAFRIWFKAKLNELKLIFNSKKYMDSVRDFIFIFLFIKIKKINMYVFFISQMKIILMWILKVIILYIYMILKFETINHIMQFNMCFVKNIYKKIIFINFFLKMKSHFFINNINVFFY